MLNITKSFKHISFPIFICILASACTSQKSWVYKVNEYSGVEKVITPKKAVILPFNDARNNINKGAVGLGYIPLFPYGWQNFEVPEGSPQHLVSGLWTNYNPKEDYPKALAQELNSANIFKESYFGYSKENADYAIEGKIVSTKYKGKQFTYCLSVYGPVLWLIGAPMCKVENEMVLELKIKEIKEGNVIFNKTYNAKPYKKTMWYYTGSKTDFNYSNMLAEIYKQFIDDYKSSITIIDNKNNSEVKNSKSKMDKLKELKEMLDQKLITPAEFEKEKKKILESE